METIITTCEGFRIQLDPDSYNVFLPEGVDFE